MTLGHGSTRLPENWLELGAALRTLRNGCGRSLRDLEDAQSDEAFDGSQFRSKNSLSRLERGEVRPSVSSADYLDELYDGRGWVALAIRSRWRNDWDPWALDNAALATIHAIGWPALYSGAVWIKIRPAAQDVGTAHVFDLEWGPWMRRVETIVPEAGVVLLTGKMQDRDGISRTCNITSDKRVFVLYGGGAEFGDEEPYVVDIRRGWRKAPGEGLEMSDRA